MIQLRTVCISAHLDSFCVKLNELCKGAFEFVYTDSDPGEWRRQIGWRMDADYPNCTDSEIKREQAKSCELLIAMMRELDIMEARAGTGLPTVYVAERWFKPINVFGYKWPLSGFLRMLSPGYFKMARRFVRLMEDRNFWVLPTGIVAASDFARLYGLFHGDLACLVRAPKLTFERRVCGKIRVVGGKPDRRHGLERMRMWCYFVAPSAVVKDGRDPARANRWGLPPKKIMWCGSMLDWKRIDTLIAAWQRLRKSQEEISLLVVGGGPMRERLYRLAGSYATEGTSWVSGRIVFSSFQEQHKTRALMREADVYVMPSNGAEGWGAVVSDALMEGCPVVSTFEAGSSATLLPDSCLYHAGDDKRLAEILSRPIAPSYSDVSQWSAAKAAEWIVQRFIENKVN